MLTNGENNLKAMRLDKWLWCARFFKTRRNATEAIKSGKVKSHGEKIKPAHKVEPGELLSIRHNPYTFEITVLRLATHRHPASEAVLLYQEHPDSKQQREQLAAQLKANNPLLPRSQGRPTKRERRRIIRFTRKTSE
jgi:ribosome-associated heat shock protein Hsp15